MPVLHCYQVAAMAECSGKKFAIRHDQSVKDGSTMMYGGESRILAFCYGLPSAIHITDSQPMQ